MEFFKKYSKFHKGYFIIFTTLNIAIFLLSIYNKAILDKNPSIFDVLAFISTMTGMLSSIYTARGELGAFTWGVINTFTYIFVAWHSQIYGQAILYIFFETPMQIVSYFMWKKSIQNSSGAVVKPRKLSKNQWKVTITFFVMAWIIYGIFIKMLPGIFENVFRIHIANDPLYIVDSLSTTMTITAVILTCMRFLEQWYFWIASSTIGIILFIMSLCISHFSLNSLSALVMWTEFLSNSLYGFVAWRKLHKNRLSHPESI
ncbi:MAG: nicotinamide riboside transporter PnuC [Sarcina sp.]